MVLNFNRIEKKIFRYLMLKSKGKVIEFMAHCNLDSLDSCNNRIDLEMQCSKIGGKLDDHNKKCKTNGVDKVLEKNDDGSCKWK